MSTQTITERRVCAAAIRSNTSSHNLFNVGIQFTIHYSYFNVSWNDGRRLVACTVRVIGDLETFSAKRTFVNISAPFSMV